MKSIWNSYELVHRKQFQIIFLIRTWATGLFPAFTKHIVWPVQPFEIRFFPRDSHHCNKTQNSSEIPCNLDWVDYYYLNRRGYVLDCFKLKNNRQWQWNSMYMLYMYSLMCTVQCVNLHNKRWLKWNGLETKSNSFAIKNEKSKRKSKNIIRTSFFANNSRSVFGNCIAMIRVFSKCQLNWKNLRVFA